MNEEKELAADELRVLVENAEVFLRAGGVVSWAEFADLDALTKASFIAAGELIWVERAKMLAALIRGEIREKASTDEEVDATLSDAANGVLRKWKGGGA
jgi:hypothetical protein